MKKSDHHISVLISVSVCLSVFLSVCLSLSHSLSLCLTVSLSLSLSLSLSKAAPTLNILQNGTTACISLNAGTAERNKRRKRLDTLSSVQEEHGHENSEDKTEVTASPDTVIADTIIIRTG